MSRTDAAIVYAARNIRPCPLRKMIPPFVVAPYRFSK